jgi:hypothetical protein
MVRAEDGTDKLFDGDYTEGRTVFGKPLHMTLLDVSVWTPPDANYCNSDP